MQVLTRHSAVSRFSDGFPLAPTNGSGSPEPLPGTTIYSQPGAPVIAVQDGEIVQLGSSPSLGSFVSLRDAYGNTYTYARLGEVASLYPVLADIHGAVKMAVPLKPDFTMPGVAELKRDRRWDFNAALTFVTTPNAPTNISGIVLYWNELFAGSPTQYARPVCRYSSRLHSS